MPKAEVRRVHWSIITKSGNLIEDPKARIVDDTTVVSDKLNRGMRNPKPTRMYEQRQWGRKPGRKDDGIVETGAAKRPGNESEFHEESAALWHASVNGSHWEGSDGVLGNFSFPQLVLMGAFLMLFICLVIVGIDLKSKRDAENVEQNQTEAPAHPVEANPVEQNQTEAPAHPVEASDGTASTAGSGGRFPGNLPATRLAEPDGGIRGANLGRRNLHRTYYRGRRDPQGGVAGQGQAETTQGTLVRVATRQTQEGTQAQAGTGTSGRLA